MGVINGYQHIQSFVPETKHTELRVVTTAATDDLTPTSGKKIRILGVLADISTVTSSLTATVRATIAFGTGHTTDQAKILWSGRHDGSENVTGTWMRINVVGNVDEVVRLTNATFSPGGCITRAVIYYIEE